MRNLRKLALAFVAFALVFTPLTPSFAADPAVIGNADKAATLKDLGLYAGVDAQNPNVGLENALTTQDSLIFLAKLFGYYDTASKLTADETAAALAKFDDAASISNYAKNVVAYSAANSILSGSTKDGKFFVGAKDTVTAARFATFMLKQMGYSVVDYKQSVAKLAETKGSKIDAVLTGDLTRDAAVGMMYGVLTAEKGSGKTIIADIVGNNAVLKAKAEELGLSEVTPAQASTPNHSGGSVSNQPGVVSCIVDKDESLKITFNKELDLEVANDPTNYAVKKLSDNQEIPLSAVTDASMRSVDLTFSYKLEDNTDYQLSVKKCKDLSGNVNASAYTYNFTTLDYKNPTIIDDPEIEPHCFAISETGEIFIIYSEAMNEGQMLDKANYQVSIAQGADYTDLGANDTVTKVNDRTVKLCFQQFKESNVNPYVKVASIMDLAGKRLYDAVVPYTVENIGAENVHIEGAQLIEKNKIKIIFNKQMGTVSGSDIELTNLTTPGSISVESCEANTVNSEGKTEVVLILDHGLATDVTDAAGAMIGISTIADSLSQSQWGGKLRSQFAIGLEDKTAPEIVMWNQDNDDSTLAKDAAATVTLLFSEDMKESSLTLQTFQVAGFTITNITAPAGTKSIILAVQANADNTPIRTAVTQTLEIYDVAGNTLLPVPGSTWTVTLEDTPIAP